VSVRAPFAPVDWSGVLSSVPGGAGAASKGAGGDCGCTGAPPRTEGKAQRATPRGAGRTRPALTPARVRRGAEGPPEGDKKPAWLGGIDYTLSRVPEEREGGVPTCVIISPLNFGEAEREHAAGPDCRVVSARFGGVGESVRFAAPDSSISPGSHGYRLPDGYRAMYPASWYPFDDPRAEWAYFRSKSVQGCNPYAGDSGRVDDLTSVGVIPYVAYEVISQHYLDTEAGYRRPQLVLRFVIGMIVSVQNLEDERGTTVNESDGGRILDFLNRVELASATIKTFREEGDGWSGLSSTRTYECQAEQALNEIVQFASDGIAYPAEAYRADVGDSQAAISNLFVGTILVTETADETFEDPTLRDAMIRTGFHCLVGDKVELSCRVTYLDSRLMETDLVLSRCLTADDLQDLCAFFDEVDALQSRDVYDFVFQMYDDATLKADSVNC
jgi:hypothetical protein